MNGKNSLSTSLTAALILVGLSTLLALFCVNKYISDSKVVDRLNTEIATLTHIKYTSRDAVAKIRGYIITDNDIFLKDYKQSFTNVSNDFARLETHYAGDEVKQRQLADFKKLILDRYHNLELLLVAHKLQDTEKVKSLTLETYGSSNQILGQLLAMEGANSQRLKDIRASQRIFRTVAIVVSLLSYLLSFTLLFLSLRAYKRADKDREAAYAALDSKNKELFKLNNSLDEKVKQRTAELEKKNHELNLYTEQLKNSYEDLEVKVKFRTLELEKNIKHLQQENETLKATR